MLAIIEKRVSNIALGDEDWDDTPTSEQENGPGGSDQN